MGFFKKILKFFSDLFSAAPTLPAPVTPKPEPVKPAEPVVTPADPLADPKWLAWARGELGVQEKRGGENPRIIFYHAHAKNKYKEDEVAWCASFVCTALEETGFTSTDSEWANSFANAPTLFEKLAAPIHGCLVVFKWNTKGQGHVGFLDKKAKGVLPILGGNQTDTDSGGHVSIADFGARKLFLVGYYWPKGAPKPGAGEPAPVETGELPRPIQGWPKEYSDFVAKNATQRMFNANKSSLVKNYQAMDQRKLIAKIFEAMAYAESGHKRTTRYVESGISDKDLVTGKANVSEGLLQVSYQDAKLYGADFDWSKDKLLSVTDPDKTIFDPYKNLMCGILIFDKLLQKDNDMQAAGARYWSVLRPSRTGWATFQKKLKEIL